MSCRRVRWLVVASISLAPGWSARADDGGLIGWVESSRGAPIAGAMVSVFGKGLRGGNLVTQSDSHGQFVLPALPPGSYTLRAVSSGHQPSPAQHIEVVANRDLLFTLSLTPAGAAAPSAETDAQREWRWLMRHKRRSVLESADHQVRSLDAAALRLEAPRTADISPGLATLAGNLELMASTGAAGPIEGSPLPGGLGALRLSGRLTDGVRWTLGGLVVENEGRLWRTAAQFVIEPGGGHTIETGAGYGVADALLTPAGLPEPQRAMGSAFVRNRWQVNPKLAATAGARYTYVGFLPSSHHADAVVEIELQGGRHTVVRGSIVTRTLTPGGDLLTLSTVAASPALTWARLDGTYRPSRTLHGRAGVEHAFGATRVLAQVFDETTSDALLTSFEGSAASVRNGGTLQARGVGVRVTRRVGVVNGSVTYSYGHSRRAAESPLIPVQGSAFHDLVAQLDAMVDSTDTRVSALYRIDTLSDGGPAIGNRTSSTGARFDVQLTQGLPFLAPLTRADWEILLAVRNMFYEASEAAFLDELVVKDPPTRVVGGISVRF